MFRQRVALSLTGLLLTILILFAQVQAESAPENNPRENESATWVDVKINNTTICKAQASSHLDDEHTIVEAFHKKDDSSYVRHNKPESSWIGGNSEGSREWIHIVCDFPVDVSWIRFEYSISTEAINHFARIKTVSVDIDNETYRTVPYIGTYSSYWKIINHQFSPDSEKAFNIPVNGKDIVIHIEDTFAGQSKNNVSLTSVDVLSVQGFGLESRSNLYSKARSFPSFYVEDISELLLGDSVTRRSFLMKYGAVENDPTDPSFINIYTNNNKSQNMMAVTYPGAYIDDGFGEIYVWYNQPIQKLISNYEEFLNKVGKEIAYDYLWELNGWFDKVAPNKDTPRIDIEFIGSKRGIQLGISPAFLVDMLGTPLISEVVGDNRLIIYSVPYGYDGEDEQYMNVEGYEGVYVFSKDKLVWFKTGYVYP